MENYEGLLDVSALVSKAKHRNQETFFAVLFKIDFCLQVPCDDTLFQELVIKDFSDDLHSVKKIIISIVIAKVIAILLITVIVNIFKIGLVC